MPGFELYFKCLIYILQYNNINNPLDVSSHILATCFYASA